MFDGIIQLDSSFKPGRDGQLKSRLGEAVREESPDWVAAPEVRTPGALIFWCAWPSYEADEWATFETKHSDSGNYSSIYP